MALFSQTKQWSVIDKGTIHTMNFIARITYLFHQTSWRAPVCGGARCWLSSQRTQLERAGEDRTIKLASATRNDSARNRDTDLSPAESHGGAKAAQTTIQRWRHLVVTTDRWPVESTVWTLHHWCNFHQKHLIQILSNVHLNLQIKIT